MSNYYETLKISQSATSVEIQTAYDAAYNQWRNLVNHHDPQIVQKANQALQALEKIRFVLMNPSARTQYDAKLNIGTTSGLSDPSVRNALPMPVTASVVRKDQPAQPSIINTQAWVCPNPKCNTPNRIGTKFCVKCGTQIGRICLKCGSLIEAAVEFCAECGINIKQYDRELKKQEKVELERKTEEAERERVFGEKSQLEQKEKMRMFAEYEARERVINGFASFVVIGIIVLIIIFVIIFLSQL
jgi:hypothetical protein